MMACMSMQRCEKKEREGKGETYIPNLPARGSTLSTCRLTSCREMSRE